MSLLNHHTNVQCNVDVLYLARPADIIYILLGMLFIIYHVPRCLDFVCTTDGK